MKKTEKRIVLANAMSSIAKFSIREAANSRCAFVFHQPKQPCDLKKYRKFCEICTKYIFYREKVDNNCAMCYD